MTFGTTYTQVALVTLSGRDDLPGGLRISSIFLISGFFSTLGGGCCGGGRLGAVGGPRSSG